MIDPDSLPVTAGEQLAGATLSLPSSRDSVASARRWVRSTLTDSNSFPSMDDSIDDVVLAVSELVTNAVLHGDGSAVELRLHVDGDCVVVAVTSGLVSGGPPPLDRWGGVAGTSIAGRGLGIVKAVSDRVGVSQAHRRLTVTLERDIGSPTPR